MKTKAIFYHAGCPVCLSAERHVADALDRDRYDLEIVHLGDRKDRVSEDRVSEDRDRGGQSVPALLPDDRLFHINFGAASADIA